MYCGCPCTEAAALKREKQEGSFKSMSCSYSHEVEKMCVVAKGPKHGPAPIPEEGKWIQAKEIKDISGLTHGIGWCAPQQIGRAHV